jgi:photosystem II stability/assembly factor-like uncharacterized protein/LmbE family N-acetylglucosaminyl deacetylase
MRKLPAILTIALSLSLAISPASAQAPIPPEAYSDAELTSVTFVDVDNGWSVGDRGVIWHTIDGGRNWQRQDSPTIARLESVWFTDSQTGWAVGGSHQPYTHHGIGVVLRTVDAGATWQAVTGTNLPALKRVKFFGPRQGIALGESSALYPGGVFVTPDGGKTWSTLILQLGEQGPAPAELSSSNHWVAGDFLNIQGGLVASSSGAIGNVSALDLQISGQSVSAQRCPQALRITRDGQAWLCGERSLLLCSQDGGTTWTNSPYFPQSAASHFDFAALATLGSHVWVAGNPGTVVFHSADAGKTWEQQRTDCPTPLRSLCFIDENRGWAVGSLGTILHTRDGGRSWRPQRQGGSRAAMLAIFGEPGRVPHEMLVQQAGNEGYLTAVEVLTKKSTRSDATHVDRTREAMSTLLAASTTTAWQFQLPTRESGSTLEQLLSSWDGGDGSAALAQLEEYLVRRIRTWRPDVIVTEDAHPGGDNPLAHVTNQLVLEATRKAADPTTYRGQIEQAGLAEWQVKKVFAALDVLDKQGDIKLICSQLAPRVGASLADVADEARGQLDDTYRVTHASRSFSLLVDHLPQGQGRRDFFSGIALPLGGEARRSLSNPPVPDFTSLSKQIQKRQLIQGLLERSEKDPLRGQAWLAQVTEMTKGLSSASSARIMYHLGQRYQASGESELAAEVFSTLVEKHADHPLADAALLWLIHYYASAEAAHRLHGQRHFVQPAVVTETDQATRNVKTAAAQQPTGNRVAIANGVAAAPIEPNNRIDRALALGKLLEKNRPALAADPSVRFTLVNARAKTSSASLERERILQSLTTSRSSGDWSLCAKGELFIANKAKGGECPKRSFVCKSVATKPKLDGHLDDEAWQAARSVSLREGDSGGEPLESIVALTHDDEFLYLAISCQRLAGADYAIDERVRTRNADLQGKDRVELLLDIDRDYATYYRLAVDYRGWTRESCLDDPSWDPTWYVATAGDETHWTVEAAIPLAELTSDKTLKKNYWSVGLQRLLPSGKLQSWTPDADAEIRPEGFGLMQFE